MYSRRKRDVDGPYWTNYLAPDQINEWFNHLATTHRDIVSLIHIGTTYEGKFKNTISKFYPNL
jgi:hypothetical protein